MKIKINKKSINIDRLHLATRLKVNVAINRDCPSFNIEKHIGQFLRYEAEVIMELYKDNISTLDVIMHGSNKARNRLYNTIKHKIAKALKNDIDKIIKYDQI